MALSGSITTTSYDNSTYTLSWTATQSVVNNTSTVSWKLVFNRTSSQGWIAERTLTATLGGKTIVNKTDRVERKGGTISSGSFTVSHNSTGGASISGSVSAALYGSSVNVTGSSSWALDTIPRQATILSAPDFTDNDNPTITYSNPAGTAVTLSACISLTGAKDDISYRFDVDESKTSYMFKLTEEEKNVLRNATTSSNSRQVKFFIRTQVGENTFYSTLTKTFTISNPNPSIDSIVISDIGEYKDIYGKYIQSQSSLNVTINASGKYGSTITEYNTSFDGKSYSMPTFNTPVISGSGEIKLSVTIKDSRGNSVTSQQTLNVYSYNVPKIISISSQRCIVDSGGVVVPSSNGDHIKIAFSSEITPLDNKNTASYIIKYKKKSDTSFLPENEFSLDDYSNQYNVQDGTFVFDADKSLSYDVVLIVTDSLNSIQKSIIGSSVKKLWSIFARGMGFAFGKVADTPNLLDIAMPTRFSDSVKIKVNDETEFDIVDYVRNFTDTIYPVGSIYMSVNDINPSDLFGGTWEQIKDKFLLSAGSTYENGATGGEATVTLNTSQIPSHTHTFTGSSATTSNNGAHTHNIGRDYDGGGGSSRYTVHDDGVSGAGATSPTSSAGGHTHTLTAKGSNSNTGGGGSHNNMPPYLVVNVWKRIS